MNLERTLFLHLNQKQVTGKYTISSQKNKHSVSNMGMSVTSASTLLIIIDYLVASKLFPNKKLSELLSIIKKDFVGHEVDVTYSDDTMCKKCEHVYEDYYDKCVTCGRYYCEECSQCNAGHSGDYVCDLCGTDISDDCYNKDCESMWCEKCEECKSGHYKDENGKLQKKTVKNTNEIKKEDLPAEIFIVLSECDGGGYKVDDNEESTDFDINLEMMMLAKKKYGATLRLKNRLYISW